MSYFETIEGEAIEATDSFKQASGGRVEIPEGTQTLTCIAGAEWIDDSETKSGDIIPRHIKLKLHIINGEFNNVLKDVKLHINAEDSKRANRFRNQLAVYDKLSGGKLRALGNKIEDSGSLHRALAGLECVITWGLVEGEEYIHRGTGETRQWPGNNYVMGIGAKPKKLQEEDRHIESKARHQTESFDYDDSDIPF